MSAIHPSIHPHWERVPLRIRLPLQCNASLVLSSVVVSAKAVTLADLLTTLPLKIWFPSISRARLVLSSAAVNAKVVTPADLLTFQLQTQTRFLPFPTYRARLVHSSVVVNVKVVTLADLLTTFLRQTQMLHAPFSAPQLDADSGINAVSCTVKFKNHHSQLSSLQTHLWSLQQQSTRTCLSR